MKIRLFMTRRMNRIFGVATLLLAVVVISCGGQSKSPTTPTTAPIERSVNSITVTELSVSATATTLTVGSLMIATATATYSDGTTATVTPTWGSSE